MRKLLVILALCICSVCCVFGLSGCTFGAADNNSVHTHSYDEWVIVEPPTCTEYGERERYCSCGDKQTGRMAYLGHEYVDHDGREATCTQSGWKAYRTCTRCDYTTEEEEIPATGHDIHSFEACAPTCTEAGYCAYEACSRCDYSTYDEIPVLGHNFGEWTLVASATCSSDGEEVRVCLHDQAHTESRIIEKIPHTEGEWITNKPTCEEGGSKYKECTVCKAKLQTESISPLGHDYGIWTVTVAATCRSDGEEVCVCLNDESHTETRKTEKLQHIESPLITIEPTCEKSGSQYKECTVCELLLESQQIPPLGHDFGEWTVKTQSTCLEEGVDIRICSRDNTHIQSRSTEKLAHVESEIKTEEPDCLTDGRSYKECTVCKTLLENNVLPATGHAPEATYTYNETCHILVCKICSETIENSPHDWYDNDCETCGYDAGGIKGLNWILNDDKKSYSLKAVGTGASAEMLIPSVHNEKPVTGIYDNAFTDCSIVTKVIVPDSVTSIGFCAFCGCNNLVEITLPFVGATPNGKTNTNFGYVFGTVSQNEEATEIPASLEKVIITGGTVIWENAFENCKFLKSIILPATLEIIGDAAFCGCAALESIVIPSAVIQIGLNAFCGCTNLNSAVFENTEGWIIDNGKTLKPVTSDYLNISESNTAVLLTKTFLAYIWNRSENN